MQTSEIKNHRKHTGFLFARLRAVLDIGRFRNALHHKRTQKNFKIQMNVLEKKASNLMHRLASRTVAAMDMPKTVTTSTVNP